MRFATLILRNLLERRARSALTVLGLAVALSAVVILTGVSANFRRSFLAMYRAKGVDLIVVRAGISNQLSSTLDQDLVARFRGTEGVAAAAASLMDTVSFDEAGLAAVLANGWEVGTILFDSLRVLDGRALRPGEPDAVMLGRVLALNLGKRVGDPVDILGRPFRVVGVFESDSLFENGGLVMPLPTLQEMMGRQGQVTGFVLRADRRDGAAVAALRRRVEADFPGVAALTAADYVAGDAQLNLARGMALATALVAVVVGSLGMLNTMMMAVLERTREIGALRALGWRRRRIIRMILAESVVLGAVGTLLGLALGALGTFAVTRLPTARGFIAPLPPADAFAVGGALGLLLSAVGGLYPASRAASLEPTAALRHD